jgi:hypothetical protein
MANGNDLRNSFSPANQMEVQSKPRWKQHGMSVQAAAALLDSEVRYAELLLERIRQEINKLRGLLDCARST